MNSRARPSIEHNAPKLLLQGLIHKLYKKGVFYFYSDNSKIFQSVTGERICSKYGQTASRKLAPEECSYTFMTDMISAVYRGRRATNHIKTNIFPKLYAVKPSRWHNSNGY